MQMTYTSGRISFTQEVNSGKQAFELVAKIAEVFDESQCGVCKSENIRPKVNQTDDKTYYKMVCECGAELSLWPTRDGKGLFIGRKDKDKNVLPDGGWKVWRREGGVDFARLAKDQLDAKPVAENEPIPF